MKTKSYADLPKMKSCAGLRRGRRTSRAWMQDEELRGFAEDEELRGFAEDQDMQGIDGYVRRGWHERAGGLSCREEPPADALACGASRRRARGMETPVVSSVSGSLRPDAPPCPNIGATPGGKIRGRILRR